MDLSHDELIRRSRIVGTIVDLGIFIVFSSPKATYFVFPPPPPVYVPIHLLVIYMSICTALLLFLYWTFSLSPAEKNLLDRTAILYLIAGLPMIIGYFVDEPLISSLLGALFLLFGYLFTIIMTKRLLPEDTSLAVSPM